MPNTLPQPPSRLSVQEAYDLQAKIRTLYPDLETSFTREVVPDSHTRTFNEFGVVGIWYQGDIVCSIARQGQYYRLVKVAQIIVSSLSEEE